LYYKFICLARKFDRRDRINAKYRKNKIKFASLSFNSRGCMDRETIVSWSKVEGARFIDERSCAPRVSW